MNKEKRKVLDEAAEEIRKAKSLLEGIDYGEVTDLLESAKTAIDELKDDEQEAFDNLSEGLQQAERGQRMEEVIGLLEEVTSDLSELMDSINENDLADTFDDIVGKIEDSKE